MKASIRQTGILAAVFLAGALLTGVVQRSFSQNRVEELPTSTQNAVQRHPLQKQLWFYLATDVPGGRASEPDALRRHLAHQDDLEKQGIMFGAGPVSDAQGNHEYGMIIIRADSAADAKRIADSDPMHMEGRRTYTLHRWTLNEGRLNVTLNFSDGTYAFQ